MIVLAALWGAATGLLLPRAAYRLSVAPEEPWREARGWVGVR
ncbi:prepilin peptidase, partial [Streptomyces sp. SID14478]|nr:prepilin peptidase [Streptomyces sp. SID14478]